jgi:hypothetical protein
MFPTPENIISALQTTLPKRETTGHRWTGDAEPAIPLRAVAAQAPGAYAESGMAGRSSRLDLQRRSRVFGRGSLMPLDALRLSSPSASARAARRNH